MTGVLADTVAWVVGGGAVGLVVLALVLIIVAPWSRVRNEPPLDEEVETRILLGQSPEEIERAIGANSEPREPAAGVAKLHPDD